MRPVAALVALCALAGPAAGQSPDVMMLREHRLPTAGPELLDFFRQRTLTPERVAQFHDHLRRLSSPVYGERTAASAALTKMGPPVRPLLRQAVGGGGLDLETLRRAQQLLAALPEGPDNMLAMAAARQVARQKPAGAVPVLFDYLPFQPTEAVRQEVQAALNVLAHAPETQAEFNAALTGSSPARRAAAAEALIRAGAARDRELRDRLRRRPWRDGLLRDEHRQVRFQAALAVVETHDPAGLPVLIDLLPALPAEQASLALDLLQRAAGDAAPAATPFGADPPDQVRAAWRKWYDAHGKTLDLAAALARPDHGLTVITSAGSGAKSRVVAVGPDGKEVWRFDGPRGAVDVQVLGRDRLLVAEFAGQKVTERDTRGNVLWEAEVESPVACQRLPDGNTFIATRTHLLIVDPAGRERFAGFRESAGIVTATRLRDGRMAVATADGQCHLLDPAGRPMKAFKLGPLHPLGSHLDVLPNGHVLAALLKENRVAEFDLTGRVHWELTKHEEVIGPASASRLRNGNTLIVNLRIAQVVELTPDGQKVWEYFTDNRPWRARRW